MRTNEEFIGEIKRRSIAYKEKQKKKRRILISCIPLVICCVCIFAASLRTNYYENTAGSADDIGGIADGASAEIFACKAVISDHPLQGEGFTIENSEDIRLLDAAIKDALYNTLEICDGECSGYTVTFTMSNNTTKSYIISDNSICFEGNTYITGDRFMNVIEQLMEGYRQEGLYEET